jgi:hypothetical protein
MWTLIKCAIICDQDKLDAESEHIRKYQWSNNYPLQTIRKPDWKNENPTDYNANSENNQTSGNFHTLVMSLIGLLRY